MKKGRCNVSVVAKVSFKDYPASVSRAFDLISAGPILKKQSSIVIKPNLTQNDPPPTTTDVRCVQAIAQYCMEHSDAQVIVADGSGGCETK